MSDTAASPRAFDEWVNACVPVLRRLVVECELDAALYFATYLLAL